MVLYPMCITQEQVECYYEFLSFETFVFFTLLLSVLILLISWILGGKSYSRHKNVPFESGVESYGDTHLRFAVHFYLIGMFFLVFDVESMYLYVWAISVKEAGWLGFFEALLFVCVLFISLIYIVKIGSFNWSKKISFSNNEKNKTVI